MANDKSFKIKNGLLAGRYLGTNGTVTSATEGYNLGSASYDSVSFSVASQDTTPYGITFKSDGTKMYVVGGAGDDINEYTLSTAWDVSTASYTTVFSVSTQATFPMDIHFKTDGTSFYISDRTTEDIFQYDMTTAWDISTASYSSKSYAQAQSTNISGLTFNNTGTKMYISDITGSAVYQYTLSTAWDVSTASYDSVSLSIAEGDTTPFTMTFNDDGTRLFTLDNLEFVFQYNLTSAYDLSTASYSGTSYTLTQDASQNYGIAFKSDGTKMYITGATSDVVYQYSTSLNTQTLDLSTGSIFEATLTDNAEIFLSNSGTVNSFALILNGTTTKSYDLSIASDDGAPFNIYSEDSQMGGLFIKPDGTKMYTVGFTGDNVYEYDLNIPWSSSSASYVQSFSVATQSTGPVGVTFKTDGTEFYIVCTNNDAVYQYTLSTAWDISTASYTTTKGISGQETTPEDIRFSSDGTKMYIAGEASTGKISEYSLSTAWDISTATYTDNKSTNTEDIRPQGFDFSSDGTKLIIAGDENNAAFQYTLSTAWDVSTASYDGISFSLVDSAPTALFLKPDGTKMYTFGTSTDDIYRYNIGTAATVTWPTYVKWDSGLAPSVSANKDVFVFITTDGGSTYYAKRAGGEMS